MPSPGEGVDVLREMPSRKHATVARLEQLNVGLEADKREPRSSESEGAGYYEKSIAKILGGRKRKKRPVVTAKKFDAQLAQFLTSTRINVVVVENSSMYKLLALACLAVSVFLLIVGFGWMAMDLCDSGG